MKLSELLQVARKSRNLTLMALVDQTGITYSMLYRVFNGSLAKPKPDILKKIAEPLQLEYNFLLQKAGYIQESKQELDDHTYAIPILNWEYCKRLFPFTETINAGLSDKHYHVTVQKTNAFALIMDKTHAILPYYRPGDLIVCYPQDKYSNHEKVLYWNPIENQLRVALIHEHKDNLYLDDLDPNIANQVFPKNHKIKDLIVAKISQVHIAFA